MRRYDKMYDEMRNAEDRFAAKVCRDFPVGSTIVWGRNGGIQDGLVVMNSEHHPRIKVRNIRTNREYWIEAYWIM